MFGLAGVWKSVGLLFMISLRSVSFCYGDDDRPALDKLSLEIASGEGLAVMGRNGCGKSTLAHIISRLVKPTGGDLQIGLDRDSATAIGLLFQNPDNQFVALTVEKEVAFALENLSIPLDDMRDRVDEILVALGIAHLKGRLINSLSGGEKQRVALAGIMIANPKILILDEPDSYLDLEGRTMLEEQLVVLRSKKPNLTEIRITQYLSVARQYQRLVVLDQGRLLADGSPEAVLADREICARAGLVWDGSRSNSQTLSYPREESIVNAIELSEMSFGYPGGETVIKDLSVALHAGEVLCVVGPSGSGKTTLGYLLTGLLQPTSGRIRKLDGQGRVVGVEQGRGRISASLQMPERQFFLENCKSEIEYGPSNFGKKLPPGYIEELLSSVGLDQPGFAQREPLTLSTGEKRRLAFAVVMALGPDFIVFDEPGCGLDPEGVGDFIALARKLKEAQLGLVVITHDDQLVSALADRVLVLDKDGQSSLFAAAEFEQNRMFDRT